MLDQHKEKTAKDPTIRGKFDTHRFADCEEKVIDLLMRVTTVSVETQGIVEATRSAARRWVCESPSSSSRGGGSHG